MFLCIRYAGILSAYGIALADVVHEAQETCSKVYCQGKPSKEMYCMYNEEQKDIILIQVIFLIEI